MCVKLRVAEPDVRGNTLGKLQAIRRANAGETERWKKKEEIRMSKAP